MESPVKVFVAGATGAIGKRLIPLLVSREHQVVATTRTASKVPWIRSTGAEPVVVDAFDRRAVHDAVSSAGSDVVVHQLTALTAMRSLKAFDKEFETTNRLRTEGTDILLAAARASNARRFVAQSFTGWPNAKEGGRVKTEADPLDPHPPRTMTRSLDAIRTLERAVTSAPNLVGVVLRYGSLYGPGTSFAPGGDITEAVRRRQLPLVGGGGGVWSFIHVDDAAAATSLAIEGAPAGVYNIVDDEPAEVSVWLPELARVIGAKAPYRVPAWIARLMIGEAGVSMMTRTRGSSNGKAKQTLHWQPQYASWREGFLRGLTI
jgi:2-alkyl-3-oxoalkanoate reductase